MSDRYDNYEPAGQSQVDDTEGAMIRVGRYLEMRRAKPVAALGDHIHGIHNGTEWEADLMLSDLALIFARAGKAAVDG